MLSFEVNEDVYKSPPHFNDIRIPVSFLFPSAA